MPIAKMTSVPGYEQGQGHLRLLIVMRTFLERVKMKVPIRLSQVMNQSHLTRESSLQSLCVGAPEKVLL